MTALLAAGQGFDPNRFSAPIVLVTLLVALGMLGLRSWAATCGRRFGRLLDGTLTAVILLFAVSVVARFSSVG
jgi:hypothetical protein